jgi:flagellar hook-length control protein FliK
VTGEKSAHAGAQSLAGADDVLSHGTRSDFAAQLADQLQAQGVPQHQTAAAQAMAAAPAAAPGAPGAATVVPLAGLAVEIAAQARNGNHSFEIRLDPPELGRIDVRLDVDRDGNVSSRLVVERSSTLDLLRRDAHQLERALQDAGLKTTDNGLQFSLRDQGFAGGDQRQTGAQSLTRIIIPDEQRPVAEALPRYAGLNARSGGIDIRV